MNRVVASPFLKVGARDREIFIQVDVAETAQEVDRAAAQAARLYTIQFHIIELRLVVVIQDISEEEVVRRQAQVARNCQISGAGQLLIRVPAKNAEIR